ncbi:MAG: ATPase, T2SS/T4P/T4SS family [Planctomycetaceae bacterium]
MADRKQSQKKAKGAEPEEQEEDLEQVLFQGPMFGREANLKANARLVQMALVPVKNMISDALARRSHTVVMEPANNRVGIRFVIDGVAYPAAAVPGSKGMAMLQMMKLLAGLDINQRREPQEGGVKAEFEGTPYQLLVDSTPVRTGGERVRIKIENTKKSLVKPADVGMPETLKEKIRHFTSDRSGVVLVCGPADTGVTTLSICTLHAIDPYLYSVYNLADVRGKELTNVTDFTPEEGHDLEMSLERLERREADVLFMDPLTPDVAQTIFDFSDRLSFVAEIKSNSPIEAIQKLLQWVGPDSVIKGLRGILTQKLIRQLCEDCKQAFRPNPQLLKRLGLPPETSVLYRAPAPPAPDDPNAQTVEELCDACDGSPYHGRVAAFELLEITDTMKEVIAEGADPAAIRKQMVEDGQLTLQKDALRLVVEGKTSLEEVQRSFQPPGGRRPPKRRPRPQR